MKNNTPNATSFDFSKWSWGQLFQAVLIWEQRESFFLRKALEPNQKKFTKFNCISRANELRWRLIDLKKEVNNRKP